MLWCVRHVPTELFIIYALVCKIGSLSTQNWNVPTGLFHLYALVCKTHTEANVYVIQGAVLVLWRRNPNTALLTDSKIAVPRSSNGRSSIS
jgi:hypothetical protein